MESVKTAPANPATCSHSDLAAFLNKLADEAHNGSQQRLRQAAQHFQALATAPPTRPMSFVQRDQIQELCRHGLLSVQEKNRTLLAYVRFDYEQAAECIRNLTSVIGALEDMRAAA